MCSAGVTAFCLELTWGWNFTTEFRAPFDLRRGWILYGGLGLLAATASVILASTLVVELTGQPPPREVS